MPQLLTDREKAIQWYNRFAIEVKQVLLYNTPTILLNQNRKASDISGREVEQIYNWFKNKDTLFKVLSSYLWGGRPVDKNWAMNTPLFKQFIP